MKFGKNLSSQIEETLPEWRDKFLSYKDLKRRLKLISGADLPAKRAKLADEVAVGDNAPSSTAEEEEEEFVSLLEAELDKFNTFFVEKEEEYIIRQKDLQDRVTAAISRGSKEELMKVRKEIVNFHGEMVLLENYSALNYTGRFSYHFLPSIHHFLDLFLCRADDISLSNFALLGYDMLALSRHIDELINGDTIKQLLLWVLQLGLVKILKKYDKRTGALIRQPFIQKVLKQPFFTTDLLNKLVKECVAMLDHLFSKNDPPSTSGESNTENGERKPAQSGSCLAAGVPELEEIEYMESLYMKSTIVALRSLKQIRSRSSTVSFFSLPPLKSNGLEERWRNSVPVVEQVAE
ncbi:hypothetical protein ZIOFF_003979 [Zingiber officinale]|uniref:SPX domain-containing protein n=1 Tax=Zingiber officinale TaxID=94328 RepID=A0A8J5IAH1_ZINOF|nr:hypothetical protein ZIOFF_003979 [Zingiber officinale]